MSRKNYTLPRLKPVYTGSNTYTVSHFETVVSGHKTTTTYVLEEFDEEYYASMMPESYNKWAGTYHINPAEDRASDGDYAGLDNLVEFMADEFLMRHGCFDLLAR